MLTNCAVCAFSIWSSVELGLLEQSYPMRRERSFYKVSLK